MMDTATSRNDRGVWILQSKHNGPSIGRDGESGHGVGLIQSRYVTDVLLNEKFLCVVKCHWSVHPIQHRVNIHPTKAKHRRDTSS